ncbi:MAG: hypothetical protein ACK46X_18995 [Candidatus Sericytochromatia bacterium]
MGHVAGVSQAATASTWKAMKPLTAPRRQALAAPGRDAPRACAGWFPPGLVSGKPKMPSVNMMDFL